MTSTTTFLNVASILSAIYLMFSFTQARDISQARGMERMSKRGDWFCRHNKDCPGGCCKGFICINYLADNELCLIHHKFRIGCGCQPGNECARESLFSASLWRCKATKSLPAPPPAEVPAVPAEEMVELPAQLPIVKNEEERELNDYYYQDANDVQYDENRRSMKEQGSDEDDFMYQQDKRYYQNEN